MRWTGTLTAPSTGTYKFQTYSDDGLRLWINGVLLIDNWWHGPPATDTSAGVNLVAGQTVSVKLEFHDDYLGALHALALDHARAIRRQVAIPASSLTPPTTSTPGLTGTYFANMTLSGTPVLTRVEAVDFN